MKDKVPRNRVFILYPSSLNPSDVARATFDNGRVKTCRSRLRNRSMPSSLKSGPTDLYALHRVF
jgi:hypothetical protein